ncbi:putative LysR family transcriptional regulator [Kitasatospora setae KM-6054]|uniref:Putative LysR family transcriptional regulator n=1 Tax=Kitasatospora setae (strain ATCC 33774 / DSM 43861 / JCM 3304 / KCC A-0304 / NBRC 14216 / KM-6054) TaxID=452652 RepID=E4N488_KITSK|nr:putative LysR family transcriptional regulator [Kitasatospora setae KM-6054]
MIDRPSRTVRSAQPNAYPGRRGWDGGTAGRRARKAARKAERPVELRQLRTFEAVVEHRTVTEAAGALGLAPSSVSEQIRALETSLGTALFDRRPRGMALTPAGQRLLPWAARLREQAEQARHETATEHPTVRLGALESLAATHLPPLLAQLADRRPELRVTLQIGSDRGALLADLAGGTLDATLLLDTAGALGGLGFPLPPADLEHLDLRDVPLVLVAAPDHPRRHHTGLRPADLLGTRLLVGSPQCSFALAGHRHFGDRLERLHTGGVTVTRACAERGLGMALLPEFTVREQLAAGTLAPLHLADPPPPLRLRLVWRRDEERARPGLRDVLYGISGTAGAAG